MLADETHAGASIVPYYGLSVLVQFDAPGRALDRFKSARVRTRCAAAGTSCTRLRRSWATVSSPNALGATVNLSVRYGLDEN